MRKLETISLLRCFDAFSSCPWCKEDCAATQKHGEFFITYCQRWCLSVPQPEGSLCLEIPRWNGDVEGVHESMSHSPRFLCSTAMWSLGHSALKTRIRACCIAVICRVQGASGKVLHGEVVSLLLWFCAEKEAPSPSVRHIPPLCRIFCKWHNIGALKVM